MALSWAPTKAGLDPEQLVKETPQMAKDMDFANAVIDAWNKDEASMKTNGIRSEQSSETTKFQYQDASDGTTLYGHLIRRTNANNNDKKVPGVLLFHTGAGPHDVSLLWKADLLATNQEIFPHGCVILVTDILSDDTGWAWGDDRTKYSQARTKVLDGNKSSSGERFVLQSRIQAALKGLQEASPEVDMTRLCALGWCLGGHSILELGRMKIPGMRAMVTFHGVFDGIPPPPPRTDSATPGQTADILICNGELDPFVSQDTVLKNAIDTLNYHGHSVRLLQLVGARHGFSNPAQDYNPNEAFAYNHEAAQTSWAECLKLLQKTFAA
ncbi:Dienelactone hydrolase family [Seminavis robusta]|uniref:Dienelactone hydrolase family n=1 Tax=Seminavis robusta TaxID=568900 RepID=A0A9N8E9H5_9STRA|nr:Dienelactone hydrolase family [Seminavis robusta]|eukprot:Sro656_g182460.1 Dienelactone hydrolase family (326) ;mRNA; r:42272-43249